MWFGPQRSNSPTDITCIVQNAGLPSECHDNFPTVTDTISREILSKICNTDFRNSDLLTNLWILTPAYLIIYYLYYYLFIRATV